MAEVKELVADTKITVAAVATKQWRLQLPQSPVALKSITLAVGKSPPKERGTKSGITVPVAAEAGVYKVVYTPLVGTPKTYSRSFAAIDNKFIADDINLR